MAGGAPVTRDRVVGKGLVDVLVNVVVVSGNACVRVTSRPDVMGWRFCP